MFKRLTLILSVIVVIFGLGISGCSTTNRPPLVIKGHHLVTADLRIFNGKTTKEDILMWLGEPNNRSTDNLGNEKWMYFSSNVESDETRLDVTFKEGVVYSSILFASGCDGCSRLRE